MIQEAGDVLCCRLISEAPSRKSPGNLGDLRHAQGKLAQARALLRESIQIDDEIGDRQGRAASLHQLASIEYSQGNYADARALLRESIQIEDELGNRVRLLWLSGRAAPCDGCILVEGLPERGRGRRGG